MFTELAHKLHLTSNLPHSIHRNRLNKKGELWFFHTREGIEVGPFLTRSDAQYTLLYLTEKAEWPDKTQLNEFKLGCELNYGLEH